MLTVSAPSHALSDRWHLRTSQGSTYLYVAHLHPFLSQHENEIDAAVANAKVKAKQVGLEYLTYALARLREAVIGSVAVSRATSHPAHARPAFVSRRCG